MRVRRWVEVVALGGGWRRRCGAVAVAAVGALFAASTATGMAPLASAPLPSASTGQTAPAVVFFGDSLTAGYGVDPEAAFPALIRQRIAAAGLAYRVVNAGVSGETTAGGLRRIDWVLRQPVAVLVLELGGNDGLRGTDLELTEANLQAMIDRTRAVRPEADIVLAGMQVPPNLGPRYVNAFQAMYPRLAQRNGATLIPFLLEGVGGVRELNQADGIHPTPAGHARIAATVWQTLEPILERRDGR